MKNVEQLIAIVDDICPDIKSSEKLFLVAVMQEQYKEGMEEAYRSALKQLEDNDETT